jgi:nitroreductase
MELDRAIARRHMVRAFDPAPLPQGLLDGLLELALRAPSAGNTQATELVVLDRPDLTARYWQVTLAGERRRSFRWPQLLDAPALVLVTTRPAAYVERYAEADKQAAGLGQSSGDWPVPYWWVDAGAVIQNLLLLVADRGLGACLFGPFDHEPAVKAELGIEPGTRVVAAIAIGHPLPDRPGRSAGRPRRPRADVIRRPAAPHHGHGDSPTEAT